jgi:hypothetical protein
MQIRVDLHAQSDLIGAPQRMIAKKPPAAQIGYSRGPVDRQADLSRSRCVSDRAFGPLCIEEREGGAR